jgi:hypothetical protein
MVNEVTNPTYSLRQVSGWPDIIDESVHTSDDQDIGDVEAVSRDFIVVKRGFVNVHRYYIPIGKVQGWDGNVLWLSIPEETVKASHQRDMTPDPSRYLVKGEEEKYTGGTQWKGFSRIEPRYTAPTYTVASRGGGEKPVTHRCVLCDATFRTDEDFSRHVTAH